MSRRRKPQAQALGPSNLKAFSLGRRRYCEPKHEYLSPANVTVCGLQEKKQSKRAFMATRLCHHRVEAADSLELLIDSANASRTSRSAISEDNGSLTTFSNESRKTYPSARCIRSASSASLSLWAIGLEHASRGANSSSRAAILSGKGSPTAS